MLQMKFSYPEHLPHPNPFHWQAAQSRSDNRYSTVLPSTYQNCRLKLRLKQPSIESLVLSGLKKFPRGLVPTGMWKTT